jgi:hypothetical protein
LRQLIFDGEARIVGNLLVQHRQVGIPVVLQAPMSKAVSAMLNAKRNDEIDLDRIGAPLKHAQPVSPRAPISKARSLRITFGVTHEDRTREIKLWRGFARDVQLTPAIEPAISSHVMLTLG